MLTTSFWHPQLAVAVRLEALYRNRQLDCPKRQDTLEASPAIAWREEASAP